MGSPAHRLSELDAVRGLAAFSVLLSHHLRVFEGLTPPNPAAGIARASRVASYLPSYPAFAGFESVVLFFMLSGFVLALPRLRGRTEPYASYLTRRVFRLYPPYVVAVLLAAAGKRFLYDGPLPGVSDWIGRQWGAPTTSVDLAAHLGMIGRFDAGKYNPVLWSLVEEMRISLVYPLIALVAIRASTGRAIGVAFAMAFPRVLAEYLLPPGAARELLETLHWSALFLLGAILARNIEAATAWCSSLSRAKRVALFAACYLAYAYGKIAAHVVPFSSDWITALDAAGFFVIALSSPTARRVLGSRPLRILGEISYSLYLLHFVVLLVVLRTLHGVLPDTMLIGISVVLSVIVAYASYRWVEVPSIALGRRASQLWRTASQGA
jgi:peptidoglycan/LPS O-acetylase OafA/YrhL